MQESVCPLLEEEMTRLFTSDTRSFEKYVNFIFVVFETGYFKGYLIVAFRYVD